MSPTRTSDALLTGEVRKLVSLKRAWDHVRSRAQQSADPRTKRERAAIEADVIGYLRSLQRELGNGQFAFDPQKGVLKKRGHKPPRPIVVAPLRNRIVHRAILDVCQSKERRLRARLGGLPEALATPTSVGGLPERGVGTAIRLIKQAIEGGAAFYIRSDLKSFFSHIPKANLYEYLEEQISDPAFVTLFKAALEVELENADDGEIRKWWELFPSDSVGVPQGSALSAISANIVLREFDRQLNLKPLTTIRYLDDFLILGPRERDVDEGWRRACDLLTDLGLEAHQPGHSDKAAAGRVADGFEFLSFKVRGLTVSPTRKAKAELVADVEKVFDEARQTIRRTAHVGRRAEPMFAQALAEVDRKIRGWGDAFRETTQRLEFSQLDAELDEHIHGFVGWFLGVQRKTDLKPRRRMWGLALLADTPCSET